MTREKSTYCAALVKLYLGAILLQNLLQIRLNDQSAHDDLIEDVVDSGERIKYYLNFKF